MLRGMVREEKPPKRCLPIYCLEINGRVPELLVASLEGFAVSAGMNTTLTGPIEDSAALYGLIARIEALGLTLISVQPVDA
jgi:hypothetical protein